MKPVARHPGDAGAKSLASSGRARDQHESAFAVILAAFVARVPGARAAALVDSEGETVDYSGSVDPFEVRLAAAHWRIVLDEAAAQRSTTRIETIAVRAARRTYVVSALPDGYALIAIFIRGAGFSGTQRALAVCAAALGEEAGWTWDGLTRPPLWFPVEVVTDAKLRPRGIRLGGVVRPLEVLGSLVDSTRGADVVLREELSPHGPGDRGRNRTANRLRRRWGRRAWRVRFDSGVEAMLVREPGGAWYADEPLG